MIYSAFQVLFCLCHAKNIMLDIKPVHDQGFVLTLTPYTRDSIQLIASIAPYSFLHAGNGYNEFYSISAYCSQSSVTICDSAQSTTTAANTSVDTIAIQTGLLSLELACHEVLNLFPRIEASDLFSETWNYQGTEIPTINSIMNHMLSCVLSQDVLLPVALASKGSRQKIADKKETHSALDSMRAQYMAVVSHE